LDGIGGRGFPACGNRRAHDQDTDHAHIAILLTSGSIIRGSRANRPSRAQWHDGRNGSRVQRVRP
jgi:hypothetical protein